MPPHKKLKTSENQAIKVKKLKDSKHSSESSKIVSGAKFESSRLSSLPVDVLLYIFKFLSPVEFLSLSQLGDPTIAELADFQRNVNFSLCRKTSFKLVYSFFSRERVQHIQKLNFSYYIFARPYNFVQLIRKCRNLQILSIIECGIDYKQILQILENCPVLKELTWNVKETVPEINFCHSALTKLFLFCDIPIPSNYLSSLYRIVNNFPKIESAVICFRPGYLIAPPFIGSWSKSISLSSNDQLNWGIVKQFLANLHQHGMNRHIELETSWRLPSGEDSNRYSTVCYNHPPLLKVKTSKVDISSLSSCNSNTYSSVVIVLTVATMDVYEKLLKSVSKVAGYNLKHLSFECGAYEVSFDRVVHFKLPSNELYEKVSEMLETVFLNCQNITVLDIGTIHFTLLSPFKAICHLKSLKVLNIPTCAFCKRCSNSVEPGNQLSQNECSEFQEMVLNCSNVEDFHLICCKSDMGVMNDTDIFPIQNWKRLKSFTIYSVIFRTCRFLRKIADFCKELQSFSLIMTSQNSGCIFYYDVIYLLMKAKKLSFIRVNDERFNPLFGRFMLAIRAAKNLEGICFMTGLQTVYSAPSIVQHIKSLKFLHLFHFYAPRVSECLYLHVKKSMNDNRIMNIKIEKECINSFHFINEAENDNFHHTIPSFSCKHLHLKQFLFESYSL